jgi:hypothetical protein
LELKQRLDLAIAQEGNFIGSHISAFAQDEIEEREVSLLSDILRSTSIGIPNKTGLLELILDLGDQHSGLLGDFRSWMIIFGNNFGLDAGIEFYRRLMTFCGIALDLYRGVLNQQGLVSGGNVHSQKVSLPSVVRPARPMSAGVL